MSHLTYERHKYHSNLMHSMDAFILTCNFKHTKSRCVMFWSGFVAFSHLYSISAVLIYTCIYHGFVEFLQVNDGKLSHNGRLIFPSPIFLIQVSVIIILLVSLAT